MPTNFIGALVLIGLIGLCVIDTLAQKRTTFFYLLLTLFCTLLLFEKFIFPLPGSSERYNSLVLQRELPAGF